MYNGEFDGIYSSMRAPCEHGCEHIVGTRHSVSSDGIEPCWVASLAAFSTEARDPIVYFSATKDEALAEGLRRLSSGGCACEKGAFHQEVLAQRAKHKAALDESGFDSEQKD
jgi:hypothetical protein